MTTNTLTAVVAAADVGVAVSPAEIADATAAAVAERIAPAIVATSGKRRSRCDILGGGMDPPPFPWLE